MLEVSNVDDVEGEGVAVVSADGECADAGKRRLGGRSTSDQGFHSKHGA